MASNVQTLDRFFRMLHVLQEQLEAQGVPVAGITGTPTQTTLTYATPLDANAQQAVAAFAATWDETPYLEAAAAPQQWMPIMSQSVFCTDTTYVAACVWTYDGSIRKPITGFNVVARQTGTVTGAFDVRIYDVTHNRVVATATASNQHADMILLDTLSNVPLTDAMLELHARCTDTNMKVELCSLSVGWVAP